MTDLEICKRIAEVEGLIISNHKVAENDLWVHIGYTENSSVILFNPLTDKALCFDLMVKYQVSIEPQFDGFDLTYAHINCKHAVLDENPQRAICLAIIEAHKG